MMGYVFPDRFGRGGSRFSPDAGMPPAEQTTVFKLLEEARRRPLADSDEGKDPELQTIEGLLSCIEAVRTGQSEAITIDGPAGHVPLEITAGNVEMIAGDLEAFAPAYVTDVLYGDPGQKFDDTPINASVRHSGTGPAA